MIETSFALALSGISFVLTIIWGPPLLRVLRHLKFGDTIRVELADRFSSKKGTPTMGGILIVLPVLLMTGMLNAASLLGLTITGRSILLPVTTMVLFTLLGAVDDWRKLRGKRGEGMRGWYKFGLQILISLGTAIGLRYVLDAPEAYVPVVGAEISLGIWYIPVAMFLIVASVNSVNFTDGMDGLAGLISATAFTAYGAIALFQGQVFLGRFCFTLVGALFGFLWFNVHPAELFMGDTGSGALGSALGVVALMTGQWMLLPIIAIIPVSETISDIIQVAYFKITKGKRFFKMAPLHYHFELSGLSETQIVQRFWLIGLLAAMLGVALAVG
jgi:phospho-N-acetylmuramoyl-pentapeptide-transferase